MISFKRSIIIVIIVVVVGIDGLKKSLSMDFARIWCWHLKPVNDLCEGGQLLLLSLSLCVAITSHDELKDKAMFSAHICRPFHG